MNPIDDAETDIETDIDIDDTDDLDGMIPIDEASGLPVACWTCRHYDERARIFCAAFPDGIPLPIQWGEFDHRQPFEGDNGIRYESVENPAKLFGKEG